MNKPQIQERDESRYYAAEERVDERVREVRRLLKKARNIAAMIEVSDQREADHLVSYIDDAIQQQGVVYLMAVDDELEV